MSRFQVALVVGLCCAASTARAAVYSDGFDLSVPLTTNWNIALQPDTSVTLINYSGLPEAPNSGLAGGPATQGVMFRANESLGAAAAANLISKQLFNLPQFQMQFDVYMSTGGAALVNQNSTHMAIWGVGRTTTAPVGYSNRTTAGNGVWGWLTNDNGIGSEDAAVFQGTTELVDIGDTVDPGAGPLFDAAFGFDFTQFAHHSPLYEWVTVLVEYDGATTTVSFNGVEFFSVPTAAPAGAIAVGYADPFSSISSSPAEQFAIIDNVIVTAVPEPAAMALALWAAIGQALRRRR